jgi:hypothetical protein
VKHVDEIQTMSLEPPSIAALHLLQVADTSARFPLVGSITAVSDILSVLLLGLACQSEGVFQSKSRTPSLLAIGYVQSGPFKLLYKYGGLVCFSLQIEGSSNLESKNASTCQPFTHLVTCNLIIQPVARLLFLRVTFYPDRVCLFADSLLQY